ncbi:MAG: MBL fold metallo-hydrolase [Deltaproteobacteria bacterium]|nr:MAG: MBL fold metallo-hydrolase [Deltaproteobacteria bacterium]
MILEGFPVGPIQANCYIVGDKATQKGVVIDPGDEAERILGQVQQHGLDVELIFNTHGHFDHVGANKRVKEATGAKIAIHPEDAHYLGKISQSAAVWGMHAEDSPPPDILLEDGQVIEIGGLKFKVLHTPGHSPGSVSLVMPNADLVFTGDLIFAGSIGRTDFPGGDYNTLIQSVREKIFTLGDDIRILSGHGPVTTVGQEKRYNPFFT